MSLVVFDHKSLVNQNSQLALGKLSRDRGLWADIAMGVTERGPDILTHGMPGYGNNIDSKLQCIIACTHNMH